MENHELSELVQNIPPCAARRSWKLRADNHGHHHGRVGLSESPLYLELHWRATAIDAVRPVGIFRLDLDGLFRDGYIRPETSDSSGSDVRLRIVRADDGSFYVQANQHGPRLLLPSSASSTNPQSGRQQPVTFIHVEYADGSSDEIKLLQCGICPLFGLSRKRPDSEMFNLGAHTAGAIAIILFRTALATERTEYPFHEPKLVEALRPYLEKFSSQKKQDGSRPQ
jgi:hypothetical protein